MVCFFCDEYYLTSTYMGVASGELYCTIIEESFTFRSHGRVKFEIKAGFIYLPDNNTVSLWFTFIYMTNVPKYKWESWLKIDNQVGKWRKFLPRHQ